MNIIDNDFFVCIDCGIVIANNDYSGLSYYLNTEKEIEDRTKEIDKGIEQTKGYIVIGDTEKDLEFSKESCHCCNSVLHGYRYHCVVLDNERG